MRNTTSHVIALVTVAATLACGSKASTATSSTAADTAGADTAAGGSDATAADDTASGADTTSVSATSNASATIVDGKLEVTADSDIAAAVAPVCGNLSTCSAESTSSECIDSSAIQFGVTQKCKKEVLALLTVSAGETVTCDATKHAITPTDKAFKDASAAVGTCVAANSGEGADIACTSDATAGTTICNITILTHKVLLTCDGTNCVCSVDGIDGPKDTDPKADTKTDAYQKLLQTQCVTIK